MKNTLAVLVTFLCKARLLTEAIGFHIRPSVVYNVMVHYVNRVVGGGVL